MDSKIPTSASYFFANFLLAVMSPFRKVGGLWRRKLEAVKFQEEEFLTLFESWRHERRRSNKLMFWLILEEEPFTRNPHFWAEYQELSFETRREFWKWLHKKVRKIRSHDDTTLIDMKDLIAEMEFYAHSSNKPFR